MKVRCHWLTAGYCLALDCLTIQGGRFTVNRTPSRFALIHHPQRGPVLFDTGYAPRFFQATDRFPYRIYRMVTPVHLKPGQSALEQVQAHSIDASQVGTVILSHFHGDHLGGLRDFPQAEIVCNREAYRHVRPLTGMAAVRRGYLPDLMPADFEARARLVEEHQFRPLDDFYAPFQRGYDVFNDGSCLLVHLPGHAHGQIGMFVTVENGHLLLAADACWHSRSYREGRDLPLLTHLLLSDDRHQFRRSLQTLCQFHRRHPEVPIYPTHCLEGPP